MTRKPSTQNEFAKARTLACKSTCAESCARARCDASVAPAPMAMKFCVMALSCRSKNGLADLAFRVVVVEVSTVRSGARFRPLKFRFNAANSAKVGLSVTCLACSDQNTDRQLDGVTLDRIFEIKRADRTLAPALQEMLAYVRHGKTVMVHWYVLNLWPSVTAVREVASRGEK